jgi:hypothetical protein
MPVTPDQGAYAFPIKKAFYKKKTFVDEHMVILLISQINNNLLDLAPFQCIKPLKVAEVSSGHSLNLS